VNEVRPRAHHVSRNCIWEGEPLLELLLEPPHPVRGILSVIRVLEE